MSSDPQTTTEKIALYREIASRARIISDYMHRSAGGDQFTYEGSTGEIDALRDCLDKLDWNFK
jgi:hypothetical protein